MYGFRLELVLLELLRLFVLINVNLSCFVVVKYWKVNLSFLCLDLFCGDGLLMMEYEVDLWVLYVFMILELCNWGEEWCLSVIKCLLLFFVCWCVILVLFCCIGGLFVMREFWEDVLELFVFKLSKEECCL